MILLTGVTGKTGGETARQLLQKGARLRAITRRPQRRLSKRADCV